jgi:hypothetical protein
VRFSCLHIRSVRHQLPSYAYLSFLHAVALAVLPDLRRTRDRSGSILKLLPKCLSRLGCKLAPTLMESAILHGWRWVGIWVGRVMVDHARGIEERYRDGCVWTCSSSNRLLTTRVGFK